MNDDDDAAIATSSPQPDEFWREHCAVIPPEDARVLLVGCFGSLMAFISLVFNILLFVTLALNAHYRRNHFLYLMILALIDVFLSGEL